MFFWVLTVDSSREQIGLVVREGFEGGEGVSYNISFSYLFYDIRLTL